MKPSIRFFVVFHFIDAAGSKQTVWFNKRRLEDENKTRIQRKGTLQSFIKRKTEMMIFFWSEKRDWFILNIRQTESFTQAMLLKIKVVKQFVSCGRLPKHTTHHSNFEQNKFRRNCYIDWFSNFGSELFSINSARNFSRYIINI